MKTNLLKTLRGLSSLAACVVLVICMVVSTPINVFSKQLDEGEVIESNIAEEDEVKPTGYTAESMSNPITITNLNISSTTPIYEDTVNNEKVTVEEVVEEEVVEEEVVTETYDTYVTSNTEALNVREDATTESEVVGVMTSGDNATIVDETDEWYQIESGDVTGYISKDYTVTGEEAYNSIEESATQVATVETETLRVRSESNEEASIVTLVGDGDTLDVDEESYDETTDDWVAVTLGSDDVYYVSSDYVTVEKVYNTAMTIEELLADQEEEITYSYSDTYDYNSYDLYLLAAIIFCEAGGEPYTGQVAVGAVVLNRVDSSQFNNTIESVIYQSGQFEPVSTGWFQSVYASGNYTDSCIQAAKEALAGVDPTGGCLYFHRASSSSSGLIIGHHVFY